VSEVLFYELERRPLESVLPELLQRSLARGWRAVVRVGSDERMEALSAHLWAYSEASFLPHGTAADGHAEEQPVFLTTGNDNPNGAAVLFVVDGAAAADLDRYVRTVFLFDAADADLLAAARAAWKSAREAGHDASYWRQGDSGKWAKQS
jgi:DNA polymerase-3 subunit chi